MAYASTIELRQQAIVAVGGLGSRDGSVQGPEEEVLFQQALDFAAAQMNTRLNRFDDLPAGEADAWLKPLNILGAIVWLRANQGTANIKEDVQYQLWVQGLKDLEDRQRVRLSMDGVVTQENLLRSTRELDTDSDRDQGYLSRDFLIRAIP